MIFNISELGAKTVDDLRQEAISEVLAECWPGMVERVAYKDGGLKVRFLPGRVEWGKCPTIQLEALGVRTVYLIGAGADETVITAPKSDAQLAPDNDTREDLM